MNFKAMTFKEIAETALHLRNAKEIDRAMKELDNLTESLNLLRNMLEGMKALQIEKDKAKRRGALRVVRKPGGRKPST